MSVLRRLGGLLVAAMAAFGCDRADRPIGRDTGVPSVPVARDSLSPGGRRPAGRLSLLDGAVLVPTQPEGTALMVFADPASAPRREDLRGQRVRLIGRDGYEQAAAIGDVETRDGCFVAAVAASAASEHTRQPIRNFAVGVFADSVLMLPLDSAADLSRVDSIAISRRVIALASVLPGDTAGRFTGLPFVVRSLWRIRLVGGRQAVFATLRRQIPQEANPLEERSVVIAETDSLIAELATVFGERSHGPEESVETVEFLAALHAPAIDRQMILFGRDYGDQVAYSLLERGPVAQPRWELRWTSPRRRC